MCLLALYNIWVATFKVVGFSEHFYHALHHRDFHVIVPLITRATLRVHEI